MNVLVRQPLMTAASIRDMVPRMEAGQQMIYHVGSLMHDRKVGAAFGIVHGAAQAAWEAYEKGDVTLVQKKLAPLVFEYTMVKRKRDTNGVGGKDGRNKPFRRAAR